MIYIDVTELVGFRAHSGIQRVVREIATRYGAPEGPLDRTATPVVAIDGRFHRLNEEGAAILAGRGARVPAGGKAGGGAALLKAVLKRFPALYAAARDAQSARRLRAALTPLVAPEGVAPGANDTVVLLDTLWGGGSALAAARRAKRAGAKVALVVYDLIPIHHPEAVLSQLVYDFKRAIIPAVRLADGILAISKAVASDVVSMRDWAIPAERVRHFYLGHDFGADATPAAQPEGGWPLGFWDQDAPVYLMVGTIEPRKGHAYVLDAFDQLWAQGGDQRLLIIGRAGWMVDAFLEKCRSHPQFGTRLILSHDATDAMLAEAIGHARAAIIASTLEGFGLPLVEALCAGLPVLASDIPVFREIAGEAAQFFTPNDPAAIAQAVRALEGDHAGYRERARGFAWIGWDEAAAQFDSALDAVLADA